MRRILVDFVPGLMGGLVGGVIGYFVVYWIRQQGFYAPVIPGALAGLGCGFFSVTNSRIRGILCALIALGAIVISEWKLFAPPVETDGSLLQFASHFPQQPPLTLIMTVLGTFLGFWWGRETTFPWRGRFASVPDGE